MYVCILYVYFIYTLNILICENEKYKSKCY